MLTAKTILKRLLHHTGDTTYSLSKKIGVNATYFYDIAYGKTTRFTPKLADKIIKIYPDISRSFLLLGEGTITGQAGEVIAETTEAEISESLQSIRKELLKMQKTTGDLLGEVDQLIKITKRKPMKPLKTVRSK